MKRGLDFNGKTIIVTGATRGIGKAIADRFYDLGGSLILTGTHKEEVASLNESSRGSRKKYFQLDLTHSGSIDRFLSELSSVPRIDVCINNAGINRIEHVFDISLDDWDKVAKVNLRGPVVLTRHVSNVMKSQGSGRIINIASIFGVITREKRAIYSATKAGLIGFTRTASVDLAPFNVLVNSVSPGFIATDLTRQILSAQEIAELEKAIPLGRLGNPEEVANLVVFLASDMNTYITGQNIIMDGGYVNI